MPRLARTEIFEPICGQLARLGQGKHHTLIWGDFGEKLGEPDPGLMKQACQSFIRQTVAEVFFAPLELKSDKDQINQSIINIFENTGIPIVLLDRDIVAGFLITEHLMRLGCRRIDFLARPNSAPTVFPRT